MGNDEVPLKFYPDKTRSQRMVFRPDENTMLIQHKEPQGIHQAPAQML